MPVGGWCDKRLCRMVECKNNSQFRLRNGSIEQVPEYANHGLFIDFQVIKNHRVLITQKCRLVTGTNGFALIMSVVLITQKCRLVTGSRSTGGWYRPVLITQKCRLVTGAARADTPPLSVLITQKCRLVTGIPFYYSCVLWVLITQKCRF